MFPLKAKQYMKKEKYVHILLFIACKFKISLTEIILRSQILDATCHEP